MAGYEPVGWKNYPDKTTSISAENLNHMDEGIKKLDTEKLNIDKITQSTAVNQDGYALDAREKNASISGTMANQISELNTNLKCVSQKAPTGQRYLSADSGVYVTNEKHMAFVSVTAENFYATGGKNTYNLANIGSRCIEMENSLMDNIEWKTIPKEAKGVRHVEAVYCKKSGICYVMNNANPNAIIGKNTWTRIGNIPNGYRPNTTIPFLGWYGLVAFIGQILSDGEIRVYSSVEIDTTGNAPQFNVSYPLF